MIRDLKILKELFGYHNTFLMEIANTQRIRFRRRSKIELMIHKILCVH